MRLLKNLLNLIQDADPLFVFTWLLGIALLTGLVLGLQGCGLFRSAEETVAIVRDTMKEVDQDGSGSISMIEIISYVIGYDMLKGTGVAGAKKGLARLRNGRKQAADGPGEQGGSA